MIVEWIGAILGMCGASLLAFNNKWSKWGWLLFLISNIFMIVFALLTASYGLLTMQVLFTITSMIGVYKWILKER